jgi:hypothetical protein
MRTTFPASIAHVVIITRLAFDSNADQGFFADVTSDALVYAIAECFCQIFDTREFVKLIFFNWVLQWMSDA